MEIRRYQDVRQFYKTTLPFLTRREAEHCMLIGVMSMLVERAEAGNANFAESPYYAAVFEEDQVIAAALFIPPRDLILSYSAHHTALHLIAQDISKIYPVLPGVIGTKAIAFAFAEIWSALSKQPFKSRMSQRLYQVEKVIPPEPVRGTWRQATNDDFELLVEWLNAFNEEALGYRDRDAAERVVKARLRSAHDSLYLWLDTEPVTMVGTSGPTPNGIRINAVYTPPEHRRKGYASALTAAVTQKMFDSGRRFCFLYTDLENPTSNHIYRALGYAPVCDAEVIEFGEAA